MRRGGGPDAPEEGRHHAAQVIYQGIPEPVGYRQILTDGFLAVKELGTIEAASYLFVPVLAFVCFKEKINLRKVAAIALILVGVVVFFLE